MGREYFHAYHSFLEALEALGDAECGRLFKACLQYSKTGEVSELSGNERILFPSWKSQIDRDNEKYEAKCQKNRQNGAIGGSKPKRTVANAPRTPPKEKEKTKEKTKEKVKKKIS